MRVVTFGRGSQNTVVINDGRVSRVHCQIMQYDNGSFGIIDFNSANGTFVNGYPIAGEARLRWNDTVQIGDTVLYWQSYFNSEDTSSNSSVGWWIGGGAAIALFLILFTIGTINITTQTQNNRNVQSSEIRQETRTATQPISIPQAEPNADRIRQDLVRRTLNQPSNFTRQRFDIQSIDQIRNVTIRSRSEEGNQLVFDVRLDLQSPTNQYVANVIITYVRESGNRWNFNHIRTSELDIVPTGRYNRCITTSWNHFWLDFHNSCDVVLLVEGRKFTFDGSHTGRRAWQNFSVNVPPNGRGSMIGDRDGEFSITRIERP